MSFLSTNVISNVRQTSRSAVSVQFLQIIYVSWMFWFWIVMRTWWCCWCWYSCWYYGDIFRCTFRFPLCRCLWTITECPGIQLSDLDLSEVDFPNVFFQSVFSKLFKRHFCQIYYSFTECEKCALCRCDDKCTHRDILYKIKKWREFWKFINNFCLQQQPNYCEW